MTTPAPPSRDWLTLHRCQATAPPLCGCGDGLAVHEIRGDGTRGRCLVIHGPSPGHRCPCTAYAPEPPP